MKHPPGIRTDESLIDGHAKGIFYKHVLGHTIIYTTSCQYLSSNWSEKISDILEIVDREMPDDEAIKLCIKHSKKQGSIL